MKGSFKLHEVQEKQKAEEPTVDPKPCIICAKILVGAYGRWNTDYGEVWTCCRAHEDQYRGERDANQRRT